MSDDCANNWGIFLFIWDRLFSRRSSDVVHLRESTFSDLFRSEVLDTFKGLFHLMKVMPSGSDAQMWAIFQATDGHISSLVTATGSYVSGSNGGLQNWSTSDFSVMKCLSNIMSPDSVRAPFVKTNTIPLPYHIPGCVAPSVLKAYEDDCLNCFHKKLLMAKLLGRPIKALLFELVLAGNGCSLSDRTLVHLAELSRKHSFSLIVDECMTGGRCGSMLFLEQKPKSFIEAVDYVTMGKWMGGGLVLGSQKVVKAAQDRQELFGECTSHNQRSLSTDISSERMLYAWQSVRTKYGNAEERRKDVLNKLRITEDEAWGFGCMLYAAKRRSDSRGALKFRYLCLLDFVPIDAFRTVDRSKEWNKKVVNRVIMDGVTAWVKYLSKEQQVTTDIDSNKTKVTLENVCKTFLDNVIYNKISIELVIPEEYIYVSPTVPNSVDDFVGYVPKKFLSLLLPRDTSSTMANMFVRKAEDAGLLYQRRVKCKRIQTYFFHPVILPPWEVRRKDDNNKKRRNPLAAILPNKKPKKNKSLVVKDTNQENKLNEGNRNKTSLT